MHSTSFPNKYKLFQACRIAFTDSIWYRVVLSRDLPGGGIRLQLHLLCGHWLPVSMNMNQQFGSSFGGTFANNMFSSGYLLPQLNHSPCSTFVVGSNLPFLRFSVWRGKSAYTEKPNWWVDGCKIEHPWIVVTRRSQTEQQKLSLEILLKCGSIKGP